MIHLTNASNVQDPSFLNMCPPITPQSTLFSFHTSTLAAASLDLQTVLQLGVGGGVKAGCNVWRALRDIKGSRAQHTTWLHLGGRPMTGQTEQGGGLSLVQLLWAGSVLTFSKSHLSNAKTDPAHDSSWCLSYTVFTFNPFWSP